jgi:hypothetical protein
MAVSATTGQVTAADIAHEVIKQGGTVGQAYAAAALASGIESNGQTADKNPNSSACGLFQFLTSTWLGNGGGKYAPNACQASMEQQVTVFLNATSGSNGYSDWRPDFVPGLDPNSSSSYGPAVSGPQQGSAVAQKISDLAAGGTLSFLGNVPKNWADVGGATPANPAPGPVGAALGFFTGGTSAPDISTPWSYLNQLIQDIGSGFGIGWKAVLTIIGGILLIGVGILIVLRKQEKQVIAAAPMAAA